MVLLKDLFSQCKNRKMANAVPAQIVCRLFGNANSVCKLNSVCTIIEKTGVGAFYTVTIILLFVIFALTYWLLRITRLNKLLGLIGKFVTYPLGWLFYSIASIYKFYKNLPR